jgi:hypothetical protein
LRRQPSLRSQLNQIRLWVRQGRTDAWIAHKLDVSIEQLERFKRDHDLEGDGAAPGRPADPLSVPPPELDLYEEDEEEEEEEPAETLTEEEPDAEEDEPARAPRGTSRSTGRSTSRGGGRGPSRDTSRGGGRGPRSGRAGEGQRVPAERPGSDRSDSDEETPTGPRRRRGRRGGRRRRRPSAFEATFDHGEEGYGLWLDPAVVDNPVYAQHWAGHRAVQVIFEADAITIRRASADEPEEDGEEEEDGTGRGRGRGPEAGE